MEESKMAESKMAESKMKESKIQDGGRHMTCLCNPRWRANSTLLQDGGRIQSIHMHNDSIHVDLG